MAKFDYGTIWINLKNMLDEEIDTVEKHLENLRSLRDTADALIEKPVPQFRMFRVESRSDGRPHFVTLRQHGVMSCTCPAGANDRLCWVLKAIRTIGPSIKSEGHFYDDWFIRRAYEEVNDAI